jgi:hypothetical protein
LCVVVIHESSVVPVSVIDPIANAAEFQEVVVAIEVLLVMT